MKSKDKCQYALGCNRPVETGKTRCKFHLHGTDVKHPNKNRSR